MKSSLKKSPKQNEKHGFITGSTEYSGSGSMPDSGKKFSGGGHRFGSGKLDTKGPMKYGKK